MNNIHLSGVTCNAVANSTAYARVISIRMEGLSLSGYLPSSIGNFGSMKSLVVVDTKIGGLIPNSIGLLTSLTVLNFHTCSLTGNVPTTIAALKLLRDEEKQEIFKHNIAKLAKPTAASDIANLIVQTIIDFKK